MITVRFIYRSKHRANRVNGHVVAQPAIPATPGLYIIRYKGAWPWSVYAGTSLDVQDRFNKRLEVYRESNLPQAVLDELRFYIVGLKINGQWRTVNNQGRAVTPLGLLDVENLFIRSIAAFSTSRVTNVAKWQSFTNPFAVPLDVGFYEFPTSHIHTADDFTIGAGATI